MNVFHIGWRELRATFATPMGWLVLAGYQFLTGLFFMLGVDWYVTTSADMVFQPYAAQQLNLTDHLLSWYFGNVVVVIMLVAPALSMRLFALELQSRTLELLLTSPISTFEIVLGKFLGASSYFGVLLLSTAHYWIALWYWSSPDLGVVLSGNIVLLLLGSSIIALGMLFSASTESQLAAMVLTFACTLILYMFSWAEDRFPALADISLSVHSSAMMRGEVRLSDLIYFLAVIGFFLFATHQRVESYRWT